MSPLSQQCGTKTTRNQGHWNVKKNGGWRGGELSLMLVLGLSDGRLSIWLLPYCKTWSICKVEVQHCCRWKCRNFVWIELKFYDDKNIRFQAYAKYVIIMVKERGRVECIRCLSRPSRGIGHNQSVLFSRLVIERVILVHIPLVVSSWKTTRVSGWKKLWAH